MNKEVIRNILRVLLGLSLQGCAYLESNSKTMDSLVPSELNSRIEVPFSNIADGVTASEILVTLNNLDGLPVSGLEITMSVSGHSNATTPCSKSDPKGHSRCKIYSTAAEVKTIKITTKIVLSKQIEFLASTPAKTTVGWVAKTSRTPNLQGH